MRADNSIYVRISSAEKEQFKEAAKLDKLNLSQWIIGLAEERIKEQRDGDN